MNEEDGITLDQSRLTRFLDALVICFATALVISIYLYFSGSFAQKWLSYLLGTLVLISFAASIVSSYNKIQGLQFSKSVARFRIDAQLIETLKALNLASDVSFGLQNMLNPYKAPVRLVVEGQGNFLKWLNSMFGKERAKEVSQALLKYASMPDPSDSDSWFTIDDRLSARLSTKLPWVTFTIEQSLPRNPVPITVLVRSETDLFQLLEKLGQKELGPAQREMVLAAASAA